MDGSEDLIARLETWIECYLALHPQAADSVTGVTRWWLRGFAGSRSEGLVEAALLELARQGRLSRTVMAGGQVVYAGTGAGRTSAVDPKRRP